MEGSHRKKPSIRKRLPKHINKPWHAHGCLYATQLAPFPPPTLHLESVRKKVDTTRLMSGPLLSSFTNFMSLKLETALVNDFIFQISHIIHLFVVLSLSRQF